MSLSMDAAQSWIVALPIVLVSAIAQSMTGFGFAVLAVPLLALVCPLGDAIAMSMLLSTLCTALTWRTTRHQADTPVVRSLFVAALLGIPVGMWALKSLDTHVLRLAVGITTLGAAAIFGLAGLRKRSTTAPHKPPVAWTVAAGTVSGVLTASLSMPGPPVVLLLTAAGIPKTASRATLTSFAMLIYPVGMVALLAQNLVSLSAAIATLVQIPTVLAGVALGDKIHLRVSERGFVVATLGLLVLAGLMCVAKAGG